MVRFSGLPEAVLPTDRCGPFRRAIHTGTPYSGRGGSTLRLGSPFISQWFTRTTLPGPGRTRADGALIMAGHRQYRVTDYRFGQMILALREEIGLTQSHVAEALAVSRRTIQHWEAGTAFPDIHHLKDLIAYYLSLRGFAPGTEWDQARALWAQADASASRRKSMFDERWFGELVGQSGAAARGPAGDVSPAAPRIDWGDAPDAARVLGREAELAELRRAVLEEGCRLVTVLGMGGIGKTTLAVKFAQDIADRFDYVVWRSLRDAPELHDLLTEFLQILSPVRPARPTVPILLDLLKQHRCLLILDNVETLQRAGNLSGTYREGFEEYQRLFQNIAQTRHRSCVILTSREMPVDLEVAEGRELPVRVMKLTGLSSAASQALLMDKGLRGPADAWDVFVHYYTGNPLALRIAAATVRELFGGDLAAFLREAPVTLHTLNQLLGNQFEHLSVLEKDILFWLAIERDPVALATLRRNFLLDIPNHEVLSGLLSLLQRSLIERSDQGAEFSLLPVLLEYVTDRLVSLTAERILQRSLEPLTKFCLVKSQSIDQVREGQTRMIVEPLVSLLRRHFGGQSLLLSHLRGLLADVRRLPHEAQGYAGGNLANLIAHVNGHLRHEDFSGLALRQLDLQGLEAQDADFAQSRFIDSRFTEPLETIGATAISPRGTYLAASTYNGQMRCWRVVDGKPVWTTALARRAWAMAFSPDERVLACSHFGGTVSLWDTASGQPLHVFDGHEDWVHAIAFHPSGRYLASGGTDATILIWDLQTRTRLQSLKGHAERIWSLAFSPDGELLVSGAGEETILIWDWRAGRVQGNLRHPSAGLVRVAFHPDGRRLASCCEENPQILLWDIRTSEQVGSVTSRSNGPTAVTFDVAGTCLVTGGHDGSVEIWRLQADHPPIYQKMLMAHHNSISVLAYGPDDLLATLSEGSSIRLWNVESGKLIRVISGYSRLIGATAFSRDGTLLFQGDAGGKVRIWDLRKRQYVASIQAHTGPIWVIATHPDGKTLATSGDDRHVRLWNIDTLTRLQSFAGHRGPVFTLAFDRDGSVLASGGVSHAILLWDTRQVEHATPLGRLETADDVWSLSFDLDGSHLASGHMRGSVTLWDVRSRELRRVVQHGDVPVGAVRFAADGRSLITSDNRELLKFWDTATGACLRTVTIRSDGNRTSGVAIGEGGRRVATGSSDPVVVVHKFDDDRAEPSTLVIPGHRNRVWGLALSPDERFVASGDEEGTTLVADVETGQVIEVIRLDRPYERMNIVGITGLNAAEHAALKVLGAVDTDADAQS